MTKTYTVVNGRPLYCHNTGHPCGTDTRQVDNPCDCGCCEASRRIEELEAALRNISNTYAIGPHISAEDGLSSLFRALQTCREIADAAIKGETDANTR